MTQATLSSHECKVLCVCHPNQSVPNLDHLRSHCVAWSVPLLEFSVEFTTPRFLADLQSQLEQVDVRPNLLVCGAFVEHQVTMCVLNALGWGYETYVILNLICFYSSEQKSETMNRPLQAGAVSVTSEQVAYQ